MEKQSTCNESSVESAFSELRIGVNPNSKCYNMSSSKRGVALIFYHSYFKVPNQPLKTRKTRKDCGNLEKCFIDLGFDIRFHRNQTCEQIRKTLQEVRKEDHSARDCLVLVVLSHGTDKGLYAKDALYSADTLLQPFCAKQCPTLAQKPKLFFIQACRGENADPGYNVSHTQWAPINKKMFLEPQYRQQMVDYHGSENFHVKLQDDFLVAFATVPDHYAWRTFGESVFISSLCQELSNRKNEDFHLLQILTFVSYTVSKFESSHSEYEFNGKKQIPCIYHKLSKLLYFKLSV